MDACLYVMFCFAKQYRLFEFSKVYFMNTLLQFICALIPVLHSSRASKTISSFHTSKQEMAR